MADASAGLVIELKVLRKGRGVFNPRIAAQVGPGLRVVCGITDDDNTAIVRQKLIERLSEFATALPHDLGLAVAAALAVHPEARQAFLNDRIDWLATKLSRDNRTARRRIDHGTIQLAEVAAQRSRAPSDPIPARTDDWYVSRLRAVVLLDRSSPRAIETREITSISDGLDRVTVAVSLPREPSGLNQDHDLAAEVLYGGTLVAKQRTAASQFRFELHLPHSLRSGDSHEFSLLWRVPDDQPMRTHYVHTSRRRCDFFDLRIRFALDRLPRRVWRVAGAFHREIDEVAPSGDFLTPDPAGDLHVDFANLAPGFGYGVQWSDADS